MAKKNYLTFGDLQVGERFVWFNPAYHAKPDFAQEHMVKISALKCQDSWGHQFLHRSTQTGVARVPPLVAGVPRVIT